VSLCGKRRYRYSLQLNWTRDIANVNTAAMLPTGTPRRGAMIPRDTSPLHIHGSLVQNEFAMQPHDALGLSDHSSLEVTQQPPNSWYKDQFGRKATFEVAIKRVVRGCVGCVDLRHLQVQLLYESGKPVENQNILRVATGLCLNKDDQSVLAVRIMEVSKNHQNQVRE
jgi:hypothetical protein